MRPDAKAERKAYIPPQVKQVTEKQARQLLRGAAHRRDQATVSLSELLNREYRHGKSRIKRESAAKKNGAK
jgi:hypothetical protein